MTSDATIISSKYHKSLIKSSAALTYEKAQEFIDDKEKVNDYTSTAIVLFKHLKSFIFQNDDVTQGLRGLMRLSKILKSRRQANGALSLASSEVLFEFFNFQLEF